MNDVPLLFVLLVAGVVFTGAIGYDAACSPSHYVLPRCDSHAIYTIEQEDVAAGVSDTNTSRSRNFVLTYKTSWIGQPVAGSVLIGSSSAALESYIGKRIQVKGAIRFASSTQCVASDCHNLFADSTQRATVYDITRIAVAVE